jgi:hypothetical protein
VPEISRFLGIVIKMFYNDHNPPHFHAEYSGATAWIDIDDLVLFQGRLPRKQMQLVLAWAALHQEELRLNWDRARRGEAVEGIAPLD